MTDTIQPYTTPVLLGQVIQQLGNQLKQLTWLETVYPIVQVGQQNAAEDNAKRGRTSYRYPIVYRNDGKTYQHIISPDRSTQSFAFFELNAPYSFDFNDVNIRTGRVQFNLNVVAWLNLPRIDGGRDYDFTEELIQDFIGFGLLGADYSSLSVERRQELIFNRYDYSIAEEQFLIYPYSGFKVSFTLNSSYNPLCIPAWEPTP